MRQALRPSSRVQTRAFVQSYPAPTGGWNARDALAAMKPHEAVVLENFFPNGSYVALRGGYASHATGMTGSGLTLAVHNALAGTSTLWCATESGVYNVTAAGAVGASVAARTDGKHQHVNFGDGTNNYLILCNGVDKPLYYNGTTWLAVDGVTSPALTGITTTSLIAPFVVKGRLCFVEKNSLSFWYLTAGAAGGALTEFDLSAQAVRGGYLMAASNWTIDGGSGADDLWVFVTSEGEAIVYQGTDPAGTFSKVGSYFVGRPLGRRCLSKVGGDLLILTESGAFPLSGALKSSAVDYRQAVSARIEKAFTDQARGTGASFGWEATLYPAQSALIVNVPTGGSSEQYVMNTITQAWCKFTGWDAQAFATMGGELYFTHGTTVVKAWSGASDGGANIVAYGKTAFSELGRPGRTKRVTLFRPVLSINGALSFLTDVDVDFNEDDVVGLSSTAGVSGGQWDVSSWDAAFWAADFETVRNWTSPAEGVGYWFAGKVKLSTNSLSVQWNACDYMAEAGGAL